MKSVLKVSMLGNLISLALVAWLLAKPARLSPTHLTPAPTEPQTRVHDSQVPPSGDAFGSFNWRQVESPDYPTYVTNLRQIGCPEQTIADIIRADVHSLYSKKRAELALTASGLGAWSSTEEVRVIDALLGSSAIVKSTDSLEPPERAPMLPLVFREADLASLHLDAQQLAAVNELRAQFDREIGGTNQDPADPAYAQRWHRAQPESDRLLRGMIGVNAFMQLQNEGQ